MVKTNSLDSENEYQIMREINDLKKDKTIIIITHRLNTIKKCDRV